MHEFFLRQNSEERIQANINRLRDEILNTNNEYVLDLLSIAQDYLMSLNEDDTPEIYLSLVNVQSTIIFLNQYYQGR